MVEVMVGVVVFGVLLISIMCCLGKKLIVFMLFSSVVGFLCRFVLVMWFRCIFFLVLLLISVLIVLVCFSVMCIVF